MGMITDYKYIYFIKVEDRPKTTVWHCLNKRNDGLLGVIQWYGAWRQYCFMPKGNTVFSVSCQDDIKHFISQLR